MSMIARRLQRCLKTTVPEIPGGDGPLAISNVQFTPNAGNLTVTWNTNIPSDTRASLFFGPAKHCSWNWQLSGTSDTTADAQVYDFDAFDNPASLVTDLKNSGVYCIAYFSGGTWEDWRSDANDFPASVKGNGVDGWAGEKWLDVRQINILRPIMEARADIAKNKGFNAIEWDNVDGYTNNPGFPMTQSHQRAFNRMLAQVAHSRGLAVFLKNSGDDADILEPYFDGAVIEQAYQYNEADTYLAFPNADKPGLICEYNTPSAAEINDANSKGFSLIKHVLNLDRKYTTSYVTNPPAAVVLTNTQSPKVVSTPTLSHSVTFTGLTAGQKYGFLVWSQTATETVFDPAPRTFTAT